MLPNIVLHMSKNFATSFCKVDWTKPAMEQVLVALNNLDQERYGTFQV